MVVVRRNHEQAGFFDVTVYDMNGKKQIEQKIDFAYKDIIVEDDRIILYNEARVMALGMNGVIKQRLPRVWHWRLINGKYNYSCISFARDTATRT